MKLAIALFVLVSLIGVNSLRVVVANTTPDKTAAYIVSSKSIPGLTSDTENNIFAFAMGHAIPLVGLSTPPFAAVLAAQGYVDYTQKTAIDSTIFNGVATAFGFLYFGIGEYCETNMIPGYQENSTDVIIQYKNYTQATFLPLTVGNNGNTYSAVLQDSTGLFTLACRASTDTTRVDSGLTLGPFDIKCDITVNATNFWSQTTTCSASNRYIGAVAYLGSASTNTSNLQTPGTDGQSGVFSSTSQSFFKFLTKVNVTDIAAVSAVTADIISITETFPNVLPNAIKDVRRIIFSFLSPKSSGGNIFVWDPNPGVDSNIFGSASSVIVSFWMMAAIIAIALFI